MFEDYDKKRLVIFGVSIIGAFVTVFALVFFMWSRKNETRTSTTKESMPFINEQEQRVPGIDMFPGSQTTIENTVPKTKIENQKNTNISNTAPPPLLAAPPPPPPPVNMDRLKKQGCVADGLLTGYSPENMRFIDLINRSQCYYLHRAIETWLTPPEFSRIESRKNLITKKDVVYGMFIAEAIDTKAIYYNEKKQRDFYFGDMCRKGSDNIWGEHTCQPAFSSKEYRDYLEQITQKAINLGIQSFTFGQIYWQEGSENKYAQEIVRNIRSYAKENGVDVIIGAQTGAINDPGYLKIFDYIEGGVGINSNGEVESGPCLSRRGSCWALLWNKAYASKANNVLLHLDWTGIPSDDLDIFARMNQGKRAQTLQKLYDFFKSKNMGFMMPYFGVLYKDNGGCYGPEKKYYSPDNAYTCKDEDVINKILESGN